MRLRILLLLAAVMFAGCATPRPHPSIRPEFAARPQLQPTPKQGGEESKVQLVRFETVDPRQFTLGRFEQLALQNNPSIQQVAAALRKAQGVREQVGLRPNPQFGYFADEVGNEGSGGLHGVFASQTFVTGGKLALNQQVLDQDVQIMEMQLEVQRTRVLTDVRTRFIDALAAQRRIKLSQQFREVAEKGLRVAKDRLQNGGTRPDVLQSEIQLTEVKLLVRKSQLEFQAAWLALTAAAGVSGLPPTQLNGRLSHKSRPKKLAALYEHLLSTSPQLKAARQRAVRAWENLQRQRVQAQPNVNGQVGLGHDTASGNEFLSVQVMVPLPIHNANQGNIRAAQAAYAEANHNHKRLQLNVRQRLAAAVRDCLQAEATVEQYERVILPKVKLSQRLIAEAHLAGEFDFLRVLTARRMSFDADLRYIDAQRQLGRSQALIDGLLLSGGLSNAATYSGSSGLRGQALSGQ